MIRNKTVKLLKIKLQLVNKDLFVHYKSLFFKSLLFLKRDHYTRRLFIRKCWVLPPVKDEME